MFTIKPVDKTDEEKITAEVITRVLSGSNRGIPEKPKK